MNRRSPSHKDASVATIVYVVYLLYPTLCRQAFALLVCKRVDGLQADSTGGLSLHQEEIIGMRGVPTMIGILHLGGLRKLLTMTISGDLEARSPANHQLLAGQPLG